MANMGKEIDTEGGPEGSFDERLGRLEEIVSVLEGGQLELEPSIEKYKEGVELLKGCRELIGGYRRQVEELTKDASAVLLPYSGDPDARATDAAAGGER